MSNFINPKIHTFCHLLWLCSQTCVGPGVGPGWKPRKRFSHDAHMDEWLRLRVGLEPQANSAEYMKIIRRQRVLTCMYVDLHRQSG